MFNLQINASYFKYLENTNVSNSKDSVHTENHISTNSSETKHELKSLRYRNALACQIGKRKLNKEVDLKKVMCYKINFPKDLLDKQTSCG